MRVNYRAVTRGSGSRDNPKREVLRARARARMHNAARHMSRFGRVPSREAFRGSVITCSRNNERLILSSFRPLSLPPSLSPPSPVHRSSDSAAPACVRLTLRALSPFFFVLESSPARRDLSTFRFVAFSVVLRAATSPLIVRPFVRRHSRARSFILSARCPRERSLSLVLAVFRAAATSTRFVRGF